jgi:hypothetical protein
MFRLFTTLFISVLPAHLVAQGAAKPPFDVKIGLWEFAVHSTAVMPSATTIKSDVPPNYNAQQRAQYLAAVAAAQKKAEEVAARGTQTKIRHCITGADLQNANVIGDLTSCARVEVYSSPQKVMVKCPRYPGSQDQQNSWEFKRVDSENFTGTARLESNLTDRIDQMIVAHWLGESCAPPPAARPGTATGTPAMPAVAQLRRQVNQYFASVANHGSSPLTGYVTLVAHYGNNQLNRHFYDLRMLDLPPIKAGAAYPEELPGIVTDVKMIGGVFADGSSYGSEKVVADLMERRNVKLNTFKVIVSNLCEAQRKGLDAQSAMSSLDKAKASAPKLITSMDISIQDGTYVEATNILRQQTVRNSATAVPATLDKIREWASGLMADPVKDPGGNLLVTATPAQFTCGR